MRTPQVDMEFVINFFKEDPTLEGEMFLGEDFLGDKLANTKIFSDEIKEDVTVRRGSIPEPRRGSIDIIGLGNTVFGDDIGPPAEEKEESPKGSNSKRKTTSEIFN